MKLYGSQTSTFVRRVRLLLSHSQSNFEFVSLNIYEGEGRETMRRISPVLKIPVLEDGEKHIFDSRVIFNYLCDKGLHRKLDWQEQNTLTIIDGVCDALVNRFLLKRSGVELTATSLLGVGYAERINGSLEHLETLAARGTFAKWEYPAMCLYALLDWIDFRELVPMQSFPNLLTFRASGEQQRGISESDPRRS